MEAYPVEYTDHNLPLVLLSGLGEQNEGTHVPSRRQESGARILTTSPECRDDQSQQLLVEFKAWDGSDQEWNATALPGPTGNVRYRVKPIGRTYTLPARKAAPLPQSPGAGGSPPPRNTELHSPLSPLSPGSPVFPDGTMTPAWFVKHQTVPALFLAFFNITAGEPAHDEQLKTDINAIRSALARSGFKTRFAVVLVSEQSILQAPELEERLAGIRRATALDPKSGLLFMPPMTARAEIAAFAQSVLTTLQPFCIEYYRDLTKHARRKKARGGPPPQVSSIGGASQTTSTSGWNVRYETKQGVFAEFRQEMDVAERHYSAAIEELFSSEGGVLETTNSWSPRWDEARELCDAVAIRVLRCQLWTRQTTGAAQSWQNYKLRMRDLVDRRGKGSETYGWSAWEARWAGVMAELIQRADVPTLQRSFQDETGQYSAQHIYAPPERTPGPSDRLPAFYFLHHSGYWLRLLANGISKRWAKAKAIPEEDRIPPGQSPASAVASRSQNYDLYLVPEPHEEALRVDHLAQLGAAVSQATEDFEARRQIRMSEQLRLDLAEELVRTGQHTEALHVLVRLWEDSTWRRESWKTPFIRLLGLLSECVDKDKSTQNATLMPALTWELLSLPAANVPNSALDITRCLDTWEVAEPIALRLHDQHRLSPISAAFAFKESEGHVGELLECQLLLTCDMPKMANTIQVSKIDFNLGSRRVTIQHEASNRSSEEQLVVLDASNPTELDDGSLRTTADLNLRALQMRVITIPLLLREAQLIDITELTLHLEASKFTLAHEFTEDAIQPSRHWYFEKNGQVESVLLPHFATRSINVLPKPPKMKIMLNGLRKQYYTDEQIRLSVELVNDELEAVHASTVPKVIGQAGEVTTFQWADMDATETVRSIEDLPAAATKSFELLVQGPSEPSSFTLTLDLRYTLVSDASTPLTKTVTFELIFELPFEAKFTFAPRLHPDPWPSYFDPAKSSGKSTPDGIPQLWKLGAQLGSLVDEALKIDKLELLIHDVQGESDCQIHDAIIASELKLAAHGKTMSAFELSTCKYSLDDRRPSYLELSLVVSWSRVDNSHEHATTKIIVPRLTIPTSEPRVLCTTKPDPSATASIILEYHLENPSAHFLTFGCTMEGSEDFGFGGPKYRSLSLAPLSRHRIDYRLLSHKELQPGDEGVWLSPSLSVVDSYYQKNLRVHPGGPSVRVGAKAGDIEVWVAKESI